ncbi:hypothetical protein SPACI_007230 [Sporomusa acidovorans DSM 3132]|uniref:Uncharacterized protein n=2 Tax=Sporomusa TaxID=2375 RepID=A0ABZ3IXZ4_SPOA4|nr:hypothetical protein SPACI_46790 [Sporomusa acidovorans DSM 3132]SDF29213.1 hypothetical protein SAMN04488499_10422 [Sporomusa acidovorans]
MFCGLLGAGLLFWGAFAPLFRFSLPGLSENLSVSYFTLRNIDLIRYGGTDGILLLVVALLSGVLVLYRKYRMLYIAGIVALGTICSTCVAVYTQLLKLGLAGRLIGSTIELQWGCGLLVLAPMLLFTCAYLATDQPIDE